MNYLLFHVSIVVAPPLNDKNLVGWLIVKEIKNNSEGGGESWKISAQSLPIKIKISVSLVKNENFRSALRADTVALVGKPPLGS